MNNKRYDTYKVKVRNFTLPKTYSWSSRTVARAKELRSGNSVIVDQEGIYHGGQCKQRKEKQHEVQKTN